MCSVQRDVTSIVSIVYRELLQACRWEEMDMYVFFFLIFFQKVGGRGRRFVWGGCAH